MLTTCGLRHVGAADDRHVLHGRYSHQRARVRRVDVTTEDGYPVVWADAVISEPDSFVPLLELHREISTRAGSGLVRVRDAVHNSGLEPEPVELLYHLNFPYRNDTLPALWVAGEPVREELFEKAQTTVALPLTESGSQIVEIRPPDTSVVITLRWSSSVLSRLYLWTYPTDPQGGIMSVEPSTKPLLGEAAGPSRALELASGARIDVGFTMEVRSSE